MRIFQLKDNLMGNRQSTKKNVSWQCHDRSKLSGWYHLDWYLDDIDEEAESHCCKLQLCTALCKASARLCRSTVYQLWHHNKSSVEGSWPMMMNPATSKSRFQWPKAAPSCHQPSQPCVKAMQDTASWGWSGLDSLVQSLNVNKEKKSESAG